MRDRPASACIRRPRASIDFDAIGRQHLERAGEAGADSACVSMPRNRGPSMPLPLAVVADGLADGQYVPFVEGVVECRAAMSRRAERHPLRRHGRIGYARCNKPSPASGTSTSIDRVAGLPASGLDLAGSTRASLLLFIIPPTTGLQWRTPYPRPGRSFITQWLAQHKRARDRIAPRYCSGTRASDRDR